jgi:hypothetical protein
MKTPVAPVSGRTYSILYSAAALAAILFDVAWSSWWTANNFGYDVATFGLLALMFAFFACLLLWWLRRRELAREMYGLVSNFSFRRELFVICVLCIFAVGLRRLVI